MTGVGDTFPIPFEECRSRVVSTMKKKQDREKIRSALEKLEAAAVVEVQPDALELIAGSLRRAVEVRAKEQEAATPNMMSHAGVKQ